MNEEQKKFLIGIIDNLLDCPMFEAEIAVNDDLRAISCTEKAFSVKALQDYYSERTEV